MRIGGNRRVRELLGLLETGNLLLVRLLLRQPAAARSLPGMIYRDYASLGGPARWQSKPLNEILPASGQRITVEYLAGEGIASPIDELAIMALVTATVQPTIVFEIGTFRGRTALNFALNSPPDAIVYTLDLPPGGRAEAADRTTTADGVIIAKSEPGVDYRRKPGSEKIRQLYGDSRTFDFAPYEGTVGLFLVDGAHDYATARSDTERALACTRPGGWILWHDFGNYGEYNDVTRAVLELVPSAVQIGNTQLAIHQKA